MLYYASIFLTPIIMLLTFGFGPYIKEYFDRKRNKQNLFFSLLNFRFTTNRISREFDSIELFKLKDLINEIPKHFDIFDAELLNILNSFNATVHTEGIKSDFISPVFDILLLCLAKKAKLKQFKTTNDLDKFIAYLPKGCSDYNKSKIAFYDTAKDALFNHNIEYYKEKQNNIWIIKNNDAKYIEKSKLNFYIAKGWSILDFNKIKGTKS